MNYSDNNSNKRPGNGPRSQSVHQVVCADLKAWLDGELGPGRSWYIRLHLLCCRECREEVRWLKRLGEDMRDLEKAVPGPALRARIMAALPDLPPGGAVRPVFYRPVWPRFALSGAALLVLGAAAFAAIQAKRNVPDVSVMPVVPASKGAGLANSVPAQEPRKQESEPVVEYTPPPITDPTTLEANRLAEQQEEEKARLELLNLGRNRSNWSKLVAKLPGVETKNRAGKPERLNLTLSVPDIAEALMRLQVWAQSARSAAVVAAQPGTTVQGPAPAAPTVNSGTDGFPAPVLADSHTIVLRVPVNRIASLQPVLRQLGAWDRSAAAPETLTPPGTTWSPASALPSKEAVRPPKVERTDAAVDRTESGTGNALKTAGAAHSPDQTAARDSGPVLVTLVVHLNSLDNELP